MHKIFPQFFFLSFTPKLIRPIICLVLVFASLANVMATPQQVAVEGTVLDDANSALPGVSIIEKGTTNGTVSDADGKFTLSVNSSQSVLVFSFVGMKTQEVTVGNQKTIAVQLLSDASTLAEVVVVGYGTQNQKDVTASVTSLKTEDFNKGIINSPEQLLQGKVAGVNVTSTSGEPGAVQSISIRGPGGVRTGSTPLFVVDGLPLDNSSTGGVNNPLNFINPQDIASIDVLKDASATAVYGSRGANGVVMITTKKGKSGTSKLSYDVSYGVSKMARPIDVFSADEYRQRVVETGGILEDSLANTDWQKEVSRTAITQNHNLSFSAGSEKLVYYASLGMQNQEGVLKNSSLKRYTGRLNATQKLLNDKLTVDFNLNATNTVNERPPIETLIGGALSTNPTYPAYDDAGNPYRYPSGVNPLRSLQLYKDVTTINRVIGNIAPSLEIVKGLVYKLNFGVDNASAVRNIESLPSLVPTQDGRLETQYNTNTNSLIENYLTYTVQTGSHSVTAVAGHSYQKIRLQAKGFSINKFPLNNVDPSNSPGLGQDLTLTNNRPSGFTTVNELQSFFGKVNYQYRDRYLLSGIVRVDGSSKFGENNRYGTFPAISLGWILTEEDFMTNLPVSTLKLRAGWGRTGNQEIPSKITKSFFTTNVSSGSTYPLDNGAYPAGTVYSRLANPDIQWEVSTQVDIGLDFGLFNNTLTGTIDYFNKETSKILLQVIPLDPVKPVPFYWTNVDGMRIVNKGVEFSLNYLAKVNEDLKFNVGGNLTLINNNVTGSPYTVIISGNATGSGLTSATINGYVNNEPIGTFYLKEFIGFDENGISKYADTDGDGFVTDKDRIAAGSALPTSTYSFYATANYKGFDLSVNFNGVSGNKIYDNTANALFYKLKISKGVNTTAEAIQYPQESANNPAPVSTRYLKDGSYLRLNNATLGYNLKPGLVGLDRWVNSIRLSVTGQNLLLITDYDGYDPEVNIDRQVDGVLSYGIDYLTYPKARTFLVGLNIGF